MNAVIFGSQRFLFSGRAAVTPRGQRGRGPLSVAGEQRLRIGSKRAHHRREELVLFRLRFSREIAHRARAQPAKPADDRALAHDKVEPAIEEGLRPGVTQGEAKENALSLEWPAQWRTDELSHGEREVPVRLASEMHCPGALARVASQHEVADEV